MAGSYPDYPAPRMAYHLDGTLGFMIDRFNVVTNIASGTLAALNQEGTSIIDLGGTGATSGTSYGGLIFPALIDLDAMYLAGPNGTDIDLGFIQTSANTTNGLDGTWTNLTYTLSTAERPASPGYRSDVQTVSRDGIKAIRLGRDGTLTDLDFYAWHVFGSPSTLPSGQNLAIWHPTLDQPIGAAAFDWGNVPRGSQATATFRVKNLSGSQQANSITVRWIDSTDSSPSFTDQHEINAGSGYAATQNIGNLASGAISSVLTARFTASLTQPLSLWATILEAEAGSWT